MANEKETIEKSIDATTAPDQKASATSSTPNSLEDKKVETQTTSEPIAARIRMSSRGSKDSAADSRRRGPKKSRPERERSEFEQRIIGIRRVTRVVSGGRRFSFSVAMVVGDRKGRVGVGLGKSTDTSLAIDKAVRDAKKNMIKINFSEGNTVPHELTAKFNASIVEIRPAPGRGLVAGSSVRDVLDLAGAQNVSAKLLSRSKNKINNARAALVALEPISKRTQVSLVSDRDRNSPRGGSRNSGPRGAAGSNSRTPGRTDETTSSNSNQK